MRCKGSCFHRELKIRANFFHQIEHKSAKVDTVTTIMTRAGGKTMSNPQARGMGNDIKIVRVNINRVPGL